MRNLIALFIITIIFGCSKIPEAGYICKDVQNEKLKVVLYYLDDLRDVYTKNDWVTDGISMLKREDWEPNREKPIQIDDGMIIELYENYSLSSDGGIRLREFTYDDGNGGQNTAMLPVNDYRDTFFIQDTFEFEIYEYVHPFRVDRYSLIRGKDYFEDSIDITLRKKFKCSANEKVIENLKAEFSKI